MSAYMVSKEQIDAMVTFALGHGADRDRLTWLWPTITQQDREEASTPGVAITAGDVALAEARWHQITRDEANRVGAMLWSENVRSVGYRYDEPEEGELPGGPENIVEAVAGYRYEPNRDFAAVEILKAVANYEYQSCEHPGWTVSEAHAFCEALRHQAIDKLPGYNAAPWGIDERRRGPVPLLELLEGRKPR